MQRNQTIIMAMQTKVSAFKILMLPWLAHGHISPYLELAKRVSKRDFIVYLCSTPVNLDSIKPNISKESYPSIEFVEIHLESTPDLPPHYHTTKGLPIHLMQTLQSAFAMAAPNLESILKNLEPDILLVDGMIISWVSPISYSLNIPLVPFSVHGAITPSFFIKQYVPFEFPSPNIHIHDYWKSKYPTLYGDQTPAQSPLKDSDKSADIALIKTFTEIEAKYVDFLTLSLGKKVVPTGPLVQQPSGQYYKSDIIEWLDMKEPFSTVFVSFGSEFYLSKEEIEEIAYGLEISKVNFIWVIRFPMGEEMELEEALPKGFIERVGERGKMVQGWAPQAQILRHSGIGGHVSHCGWSSCMESLMFGVPVIGVPMHLDNPLYAILMEEIGVGFEVQRDEKGKITREEVGKVIKKVVIEKTGEDFRKKAKEMSEVLIKKDEEEIDGVVKELVRLCEMKRVSSLEKN